MLTDHTDLPTREEQLSRLNHHFFDVLVIGGGATGAGIALDAASRGLSVALVEAGDFGSGTSSRSSKLVHGGVRYLEAAVKTCDRSQLHLVKEALRERAILLKNAPHLSRALPLMIPLYSYLEIPYYLFGLKFYDWLSGKRSLGKSHFLSANETLKNYPLLHWKGLKGSVVFYDGQFDDARMNISLVITAVHHGAVTVNYLKVVELIKKEEKIAGALVEDQFTKQRFPIHARVTVNATGPFSDQIRHLDDPQLPALLRVSAGSHLLLDKQLGIPESGIMLPKTTDGRVLFVLPWLGQTLVGTTEASAELSWDPQPSEKEIDYLLDHLNRYVDFKVERAHVSATWAGLRPLVQNSAVKDSAQLSRDHFIEERDSGLLTIVGGKWTTYRKMAEDLVDRSIISGQLLPKRRCQTAKLRVVGSLNDFQPVREFLKTEYHFEIDVIEHLLQAYGCRAIVVAQLAKKGFHERLVSGFPYLEAEVIYAKRYEYACVIEDVVARRLRLQFLDEKAALRARSKIAALMA